MRINSLTSPPLRLLFAIYSDFEFGRTRVSVRKEVITEIRFGAAVRRSLRIMHAHVTRGIRCISPYLGGVAATSRPARSPLWRGGFTHFSINDCRSTFCLPSLDKCTSYSWNALPRRVKNHLWRWGTRPYITTVVEKEKGREGK